MKRGLSRDAGCFLAENTYPGDFALHLHKVLFLCPRKQLLSACDGQDNGISHAIIVQAEIYCALKVTSQQSLGNQAIHICKRAVPVQTTAEESPRNATAGDSVPLYNTTQLPLQSSLPHAGTQRDAPRSSPVTLWPQEDQVGHCQAPLTLLQSEMLVPNRQHFSKRPLKQLPCIHYWKQSQTPAGFGWLLYYSGSLGSFFTNSAVNTLHA